MRTSDLLDAFQRRGWSAAYASPSAPNEHTALLAAAGVATFSCQANRESQLADVLAAVQPTAVVFDRFYAEEAFSFRVRELFPGALRILVSGQARAAVNTGAAAWQPGNHHRRSSCAQSLCCQPPALAPLFVSIDQPTDSHLLLSTHSCHSQDMQDFHALRSARQAAAEAGAPLDAVLAARPTATAPDCLRELAAIHRCGGQ